MENEFAVTIFRLYVAHESTYYLGIHIKSDNYGSRDAMVHERGKNGVLIS